MRLAGTVLDVAGFGVNDHVSWPYVDRDDFCRHATTFLHEGLGLGLRVVYAGEGPAASLLADLERLPGRDDALASGALQVSSLGELYAQDEPVDPARMLDSFAAATEEALRLGYAGLRVAADATPLLRSPEQVDAFAVWEHKADRYMTEHPLSALCGFDRARLSERAASALACLHPLSPPDATLFRLYAADGDAHLALSGEVDGCVSEQFEAALAHAGVRPSGELVVDAEGLEFVDHRALISLRARASRCGAGVVVRTSHPLPARLIELLGLDAIRVDSPEGLEVVR